MLKTHERFRSALISLPLISGAMLFAGCGGADEFMPVVQQSTEAASQGALEGLPMCSSRTGGALITFQISTQSISLWMTNSTFIDEAKRLLASGQRKIPVFHQVIDGADCDPQWTFHVDPASAVFASYAVELCDASPVYIEQDTPKWISRVGTWCPWNARVVHVSDQR